MLRSLQIGLGNVSQHNHAFTLVELVVVIAVLAILGAVSNLSYQGMSANTRDTSRVTDLTNLYSGLSVYYQQQSRFPLPDTPSVRLTYGGTVIGYQ